MNYEYLILSDFLVKRGFYIYDDVPGSFGIYHGGYSVLNSEDYTRATGFKLTDLELYAITRIREIYWDRLPVPK